MLVLDLLQQRLLIHQLRKCFFLINKLQSANTIFFPRIQQLQNTKNRTVESERPHYTIDTQFLHRVLIKTCSLQTWIKFKIWPFIFFQIVFVCDQSCQMYQINLTITKKSQFADNKCTSHNLFLVKLDHNHYIC